MSALKLFFVIAIVVVAVVISIVVGIRDFIPVFPGDWGNPSQNLTFFLASSQFTGG